MLSFSGGFGDFAMQQWETVVAQNRQASASGKIVWPCSLARLKYFSTAFISIFKRKFSVVSVFSNIGKVVRASSALAASSGN